ncbi:MAG: riboflavin synthase [Acidaminococcaceae bacterium]|nr:riboflavin synthase [Acidaminococcaceae bacterium]MDO4935840.1 riboflavin synthase [Phascolarctobacterium sp.]
MFTGLIEELGEVKNLAGTGNSYRLTIAAQKILENIKIGDSVAVNGACLTVVEKNENSFMVDVMPETAKHTTIAQLHTGEGVNLERTLCFGERLEGHLVSGHIEGVGRILQRQEDGNALLFKIACDKTLTHYIIKKGSIAVDGISLTVVDVDENSFQVSIIPHTAAVTTLGFKRVGNKVNIETDLIGKYIEKFVGKRDEFWKSLVTQK